VLGITHSHLNLAAPKYVSRVNLSYLILMAMDFAAKLAVIVGV
jgi:hypothetical protein